MSVFAAEGRRAELVGGIALILVGAAVVFMLFLSGGLHLGTGVHARVYFASVGALKEGASVRVAGREVGVVESIALVPRTGLPATHPLAGVGGAVAIIRVKESARAMVPIDGEIFVSSRGLLAERYLEIGPPRGGVAHGRPIADGDELRGVDPPSIDRALQRTWDNLVRTRVFLEAVRPDAQALIAQLRALAQSMAAVEPAPGAFRDVLAELDAATAEASRAWQSIQDAGADPAHLRVLAASVGRTALAARQAMALVRARATVLGDGLDQLATRRPTIDAGIARARAALAQVDVLGAKVDSLLAKVQDVADRFARGEGSIAKLQRDPEFPEDAKELGKLLKRQPWLLVGHPREGGRDERDDAPP